jgi:hypothetical protein
MPKLKVDLLVAIGLCYAVAGWLLWSQVGPWEMVRHVLVNGLLVIAWFWSASAILRGVPVPSETLVRQPGLELAWLLVGLSIALGMAANGYAGWFPLPTWSYYLAWVFER